MAKNGKLITVASEVSPKFEVAYILNEVGEKPTLFTNVSGFPQVSIAGNLFASRKLLAESINTEEDKLYTKINNALSNPKPCGVTPVCLWDRTVDADLTSLPVLTHYSGEAGPYITAGIVFADYPGSKSVNLSVHRMLVLGKNKVTARIVPRHLYQIAKEAAGEVPIALVNGVEPPVFLSSSLQPAFGVSEIEVANSLAEGRIELYECANGVRVPRESEIVMEGTLTIREQVEEGPFVDLTGTYDDVRFQPVLTFKTMHFRKKPIYHAVVAGSSEHKIFMGLPQELKVLDVLSKSIARVRGINFTDGGCGYFHCVVSIEKNNDGDGKTAILDCFAASHSLKLVIVVDSDVDPFKWSEVEWALATRFQASK
jgi:UbiD family decarboxylase